MMRTWTDLHVALSRESDKIRMRCVASALSVLGPPSSGQPEYLRPEADLTADRPIAAQHPRVVPDTDR